MQVGVEDGRLIVTRGKRPRYTLDELLVECDENADDDADREWFDAPSVGRELL